MRTRRKFWQSNFGGDIARPRLDAFRMAFGCVVLLAALVQSGCLWFSSAPKPGKLPEKRALRIVSHTISPEEGMELAVHLHNLADVLDDWGVDVLLIQGLPGASPINQRASAIESLMMRLGLKYQVIEQYPNFKPLGAQQGARVKSHRFAGVSSGRCLAILSRVPFGQVYDHAALTPGRKAKGEYKAHLLGAPFRWGGAPFWCWSLDTPGDEFSGDQFSQIQEILPAIQRSEAPGVIGAYTGLPPSSETSLFLFQEFRDAWREAGSGLGYTTPKPMRKMRHSYCLVTRGAEGSKGNVEVKRIYTLTAPNCDHLPILMVIDRSKVKPLPKPEKEQLKEMPKELEEFKGMSDEPSDQPKKEWSPDLPFVSPPITHSIFN